MSEYATNIGPGGHICGAGSCTDYFSRYSNWVAEKKKKKTKKSVFSIKSATCAHELCLVLQLRPIEVKAMPKTDNGQKRRCIKKTKSYRIPQGWTVFPMRVLT